MPQFVIERDIPEIGSADRETLRGAAKKSNQVLADLGSEGKNIKWLHSYVADNKTFCIYETDSESLIEEHAQRSGFPATTVTAINKTISPSTADG